MSTDTKIIAGIITISIIILLGGALLLSVGNNKVSVSNDQVVAQNGLHWHPKLEIYIKDRKQEIPPGIGLAGSIHQELHTHDEDAAQGVIHMEMNGVVTKDETKLKNFFKVWGKKFSQTQIFDYLNGEGGKVRMLVNGAENKEFENYEMRDGDKIEIRYE